MANNEQNQRITPSSSAIIAVFMVIIGVIFIYKVVYSLLEVLYIP
jgi:hypothetical protein